MSTVAGYTICFIKKDAIKQITVATADDLAIVRRLRNQFGDIQIIGRMPLDKHTLELLRLKRDGWMEWVPISHG